MKVNIGLRSTCIASLLCLAAATGAGAQEFTIGERSDAPLAEPDYAEVHSLADAEALFARGQLVPVLLFPYEFGGDDIAGNRVYLPPEAANAKREIDQTIIALVEQGLLDQMEVRPEYRGDSFVPSRIVIEAWHSQREVRYEPVIEIW